MTLFALLALTWSLLAHAEDPLALPDLVVQGQSPLGPSNSPSAPDARRIDRQSTQAKQAQTFSQWMSNERGVDTQTTCAFCGSKRITINGLRGEHTTILTDGMPLHSSLGSFYGIDAMSLVGIDSVDVYRGAGASQTNIDSIGGAINILTRDPLMNQTELSTSVADDTQQNHSLLYSRRLSEKTGVLLAGQWAQSVPLDVDHNRVSEIPSQENYGFTNKWVYRPIDTLDLSFRLSHSALDTVGGSMSRQHLSSANTSTVTSDEFQDRDVRKKFLGDPRRITDNVRLQRTEVAVTAKGQPSALSSYRLGVGGAYQDLRAIYSHGYDYDNLDQIGFAVAEYQTALSESHLLTVGTDLRLQNMNSSSQSLYRLRSPPLKQDDLTFMSFGLYAQDTWFVSSAQELNLTLRLDHLNSRWTDLNRNLTKTIVAPRLLYKYIHGAHLTSKASYGLGYRTPLTLFESQHGTNHNGFEVNINNVETAHSLTYNLSGQYHDDFFEFTSHVTHLENLAYGQERVDLDQPTQFINARTPYTILGWDASYGHRWTEKWNSEALFESFHYPRGYQEKLPVAVVETRLRLKNEFSWGKWKTSQTLVAVGPRNLRPYGYDRHYNIAFTDENTSSPTFGETSTSDRKWQQAPLFFTLDLNFERSIAKNYDVGLSVLNVFDYTQTGAGDSPLTWELHGDHYHLDNFHIWGPLRGRQIFLTFKGHW